MVRQNKFSPTSVFKGLRKTLFFLPTRHGNLSAMMCEPESTVLAAKDRMTIIIAHGIGPDNSMVEGGRIFLRMAERFAKIGVNTLLFSFPGTAESDGYFPDMSLNQRVAALRDVIDWFLGAKLGRYAVLGFSMGGATAIHALDHALAKDPAFFITINAVPSFDESSQSYHQWHAPEPQPELVVGLGKPFFKAKPKKSIAAAYAKIHVPKLHIQAGSDIPYFAEEFRPIFESCPSPLPKEWIDIPEADHIFTRHEHQKPMLDVLTRWVRKQMKGAN